MVDKVFPQNDRIHHIQTAAEIEEFDVEEADRIWVQGRRNVAELVLDALIATHELWSGPRDLEEELVPNLQFSRNIDRSQDRISRKTTFRASELPQKIQLTPEKVEKKEEMKEEFLTPEDATFEFVTPMGESTVHKKEEKTESKIQKEEFAPPPQLHLDQSWEEDLLPELEPQPAEAPSVTGAPSVIEEQPEDQKKKKKGSPNKKRSPLKKPRTSNRARKPVSKYQAGQN